MNLPAPSPALRWRCATFRELDADALYAVLRLRAEVFVVEQRCAYLDLDDKDRDPAAHHLFAPADDGAPLAYARLLPPGLSYAEASFGRVVTAPAWRGRGIGDALVVETLRQMARLWPASDVRIGAQAHLVGYYGKHGFEVCSDEFLEDDIPHRLMLRRARS
jgi:ElaA protein